MIKLLNLEKSVKTKAGFTYLLRQINLDIAEGEFVTIMGPSGAGKSTLLSIIGFYDSAWEGIIPAAEQLAARGVDAVMVIGTSLTFYRGAEAHAELLETLRATTGLPVSTMSQAVVEGLRGFGARRIAVATAYADEVNARLKAFLGAHGFDVLGLKGFGLFGFNQPDTMREADIIALGAEVCGEAPAAEGLLISCGGLRTLGVAKPLEARHGIPVVASTQAAFWAALRLVGESGHVAGRGRLLEQTAAAPVH